MDPPSPSKFPMSPGMPIFSVSPERVAGTKPLYGLPAPPSPSLPDLRTSPLRSHRRNDSDVSVHGLAAMFENLEVKDFKEAQAKFQQAMHALQREKSKHASELRKLEKDCALSVARRDIRIEELSNELDKAKTSPVGFISKEDHDKERQTSREDAKKWRETIEKVKEEKWQTDSKLADAIRKIHQFEAKYKKHKAIGEEKTKDLAAAEKSLVELQSNAHNHTRTVQLVKSDLNFQTNQAIMYKDKAWALESQLRSVQTQVDEEIQTLKDKLQVTEGERDALKTSLQVEEVLRIAAEGHIALPADTTEESEEFGHPIRSPRKQRMANNHDDDKENVAPKRAVVDNMFLQQELTVEKRLRERAQEQIEFMKMECQFQCCSCRVADFKGVRYVHDNRYAAEIERIKASLPAMTPPPSDHGGDPMEGLTIKEEAFDDERPFTPPPEETPQQELILEDTDCSREDTVALKSQVSTSPEPIVAFSPTTGTFRSVPSPVKASTSIHMATPAKPSPLGLGANTDTTTESPPWTPDATSTMIQTENEPVLPSLRETIPGPEVKMAPLSVEKSSSVIIHEDAMMDSDEEDELQTPKHDPLGSARPNQFLTRTITTTTTIPIHFSPMTPATKPGNRMFTPSTVAHAPENARTPVLGELCLNKVPIDREAALEAIRQRRGRARSMAAGHGTPRKQMMDGVGERRDISAPVPRVRR
ncbi:hypothetical protein BDV95DRAFT_488295 [Massariosphaeria phaeospora]|uniref:Uncharacterized protein n=1 Tax=Massariosphaeria phaeospora TaxID=100035 RepID=A0A7C8I9E1_9PLEO|nr:hypothetical protein BDV95DRAFT_488295 [Massariosphaeria phaeospora]